MRARSARRLSVLPARTQLSSVERSSGVKVRVVGYLLMPHHDIERVSLQLSTSRRSWRIGQRRPVEVKFFAYKGTMQEICLRLMGKKLLVALAMEGKFTSEGLQAIDGDDDMLTAMARELVENKGIGESADTVWRALGQMRPSRLAPADDEREDMSVLQPEMNIPAMLPSPSESIPDAALVETATLPRGYSHKSTESRQLSLF